MVKVRVGCKDAVNFPEVKRSSKIWKTRRRRRRWKSSARRLKKRRSLTVAEATAAVVAMQKKWAGLKWAVVAKAKEASYKRQKDLYDSFLKLLAEKVAAGPLALPFPVQTKIKGQEKWSVINVKNESIELEPIPAKIRSRHDRETWRSQRQGSISACAIGAAEGAIKRAASATEGVLHGARTRGRSRQTRKESGRGELSRSILQMRQDFLQSAQCPNVTIARGRFGQSQRGGDIIVVQFFEVTHREHFAIEGSIFSSACSTDSDNSLRIST